MQSPTFEYVSKGWTCWKGQNLKRDHSVIAVLPFVFFINLTKEAVPTQKFIFGYKVQIYFCLGNFFSSKALKIWIVVGVVGAIIVIVVVVQDQDRAHGPSRILIYRVSQKNAT